MIEALCLALNVYFEARGEHLDGQIAVIDVTLNRVASPKWPDSVCGVVLQPNQFSWTTAPEPMEDALWPLLQLVWEAPTLGISATHYHSTAVHPYWADILPLQGKIGNHVFY